ncbi:50S ribosomal protein L21, partial [Akkermansiaceae bacterium]|nr:50S ribosomal protein L21 [Akkermansiaceae bacterium]
MSYAVFKTGGKQYRVSEGDILDVEKLNLEEGAETSFEDVLLLNNGESTTVGAPMIEGATVTAKVV